MKSVDSFLRSLQQWNSKTHWTNFDSGPSGSYDECIVYEWTRLSYLRRMDQFLRPGTPRLSTILEESESYCVIDQTTRLSSIAKIQICEAESSRNGWISLAEGEGIW